MKKLVVKSLLLTLTALPLVVNALELTPQQMANVKLSTTTVTERQVAATITANGTLRADQQRLFRVAPVVDGLVTELKVVEHAIVRKGQVLARLHSNTLGQAQADYLEALARYEVAQTDYQRVKGLRQDGIVAESRLLEAESQYKTAQAVLDQRRRALTLAGVSAAQIKNLNHQPEQIADYPLLSPADGVVLEVAVESGQLLAAGETAFRLADLSVVWADIRIPVTAIGQATPGAKVIIKVGTFPQQSFTGQLQSLGGEVDAESQTISGRVVIDNRQGLLRPGMYVQAELQGAAQTGLMVPQSAVFQRGNDSYLFKVSGPRSYEPVKITLGDSSNGWVSIKSGITAGTEIVSNGVAELKSHWQYQGDK
ncbi:MAG: efflux RND transporter periplasmic adaptor subunit [Gammaproteobacteria bacterium]|nr:efflux RND transporter periplasmic adaptor subunit [Gammaproteobacteria bacterium]